MLIDIFFRFKNYPTKKAVIAVATTSQAGAAAWKPVFKICLPAQAICKMVTIPATNEIIIFKRFRLAHILSLHLPSQFLQPLLQPEVPNAAVQRGRERY